MDGVCVRELGRGEEAQTCTTPNLFLRLVIFEQALPHTERVDVGFPQHGRERRVRGQGKKKKTHTHTHTQTHTIKPGNQEKGTVALAKRKKRKKKRQTAHVTLEGAPFCLRPYIQAQFDAIYGGP